MKISFEHHVDSIITVWRGMVVKDDSDFTVEAIK